MTKSAAIELAEWNIRVNAICPGNVDTPLARGSATAFDLVTRFTPQQRAAQPDEIAGLVLFLASDDSAFITGEDIAIDGGLMAGGLFGYVGKQAGAIGQADAGSPRRHGAVMTLKMPTPDRSVLAMAKFNRAPTGSPSCSRPWRAPRPVFPRGDMDTQTPQAEHGNDTPVTLDDKYLKLRGRVYMTGTQALVRLLLAQKQRDAAAGLNTGGFGSPGRR